jgi:hypothetical protein
LKIWYVPRMDTKCSDSSEKKGTEHPRDQNNCCLAEVSWKVRLFNWAHGFF